MVFPYQQLRVGRFTLFVASIVACTSSEPVASVPNNGMTLDAKVRRGATLHDELLQLSRDVPGFAAIYYDSLGGLVVRSTVQGISDASRSRLKSFLRRYTTASVDLDPLVAGMRILPAVWDYSTLAVWYEEARSALSKADVNSTRIDEYTNQIVIGVSDLSSASQLAADLTRRGVPAGALRFEQMGPAVLDASLTDAVRPRVGGLRITNANISASCTLGFNAYILTESGYDFRYFLTNAHCMTITGEVTGSLFLQPGFYQTQVGVEVENPPFFPCTAGQCRYADVAVVQYDDTVTHSLGVVARTPGPNNLLISGFTNIQGGIEGAIAGTPVKKIGAATGETSGSIVNACVDLSVTDRGITYTLLCQEQASYARGEGDSGAPVIVVDPRDPNAPYPVGLHWGHNISTGRANLSTMNNIHADLGYDRYQVQ